MSGSKSSSPKALIECLDFELPSSSGSEQPSSTTSDETYEPSSTTTEDETSSSSELSPYLLDEYLGEYELCQKGHALLVLERQSGIYLRTRSRLATRSDTSSSGGELEGSSSDRVGGKRGILHPRDSP